MSHTAAKTFLLGSLLIVGLFAASVTLGSARADSSNVVSLSTGDWKIAPQAEVTEAGGQVSLPGYRTLLYDLGRDQEALVVCERAIHQDPNFAYAYFTIGSLLYELGRNQEALAACEQAIRLDPNFALAYCNMSFVLHEFGRNQEALAAL